MELYGYAEQFTYSPTLEDAPAEPNIASLIYDGSSHLDQVEF